MFKRQQTETLKETERREKPVDFFVAGLGLQLVISQKHLQTYGTIESSLANVNTYEKRWCNCQEILLNVDCMKFLFLEMW